MTQPIAFQDRIPNNHCFGCGSLNHNGLQIKSYWESGDTAICEYQPLAFHAAGPTHLLNGGIIATVIDCHTVCTAMAHAYRQVGREIGEGELIWYVTGKLEVNYLAPVPIDHPIVLRATVDSFTAKKTVLSCELTSSGVPCARAHVVAVHVPNDWFANH